MAWPAGIALPFRWSVVP